MQRCSEHDFERHPDPAIADVGKAGGIEVTIGRCRSCGQPLAHCWAGGVVGGVRVVSREWVDRVTAADPASRRSLLAEWLEEAS